MASSADWSSPARLPRVLRRAGCRVEVFCEPRRALAHTRFADQVHAAPDDLPAFVEALRAHLTAHRYDWVLIADDPLLAALAARAGEPWLDGILPIAAAHPHRALLASKAGFVDAAAACGLPAPASAVAHSAAEAAAAAERIGYPVMLKRSESFAGLGVRLAASADEFAAAFAAVVDGGDGGAIVLQKFIDGPIGNTIALFDRGRAICWMSAYKVRTWPGPFGPSSARRFMSHPDAEPMLHAIGGLTGYHGFCALDWVCDAAGRLIAIELNARPVPTIHLCRAAGVDFSRAVRGLLDGGGAVQRPPALGDGAPVIAMFPEDLYRASTEKSGASFGWLRDVPWADWPLCAWHWRKLRDAGRAERQRKLLQSAKSG
jgi:biotin carboxylase